MRTLLLTVATVLLTSGTQAGVQSTDAELIKQAAPDYIEGWYEGNAELMERAVHPELVKRIVQSEAGGRSRLGQMSAMTSYSRLGEAVERARQKRTSKRTLQFSTFSVMPPARKLWLSDWIDYMHLARWHGRWVIVNVLWELKPSPKGH